MTSRFAFGLLVCLIVAGGIPKTTGFVDKISEYAKQIIAHITDAWEFITTRLGPSIGNLYEGSKRLVGCANAAKNCGVDSDLDHKDPCGSARKVGWCVFNSCPEVTGTEEENGVIEILNSVFAKIPECEFRAEALAEEFRHRNGADRQVSTSRIFVFSWTLLGIIALRKVIL